MTSKDEEPVQVRFMCCLQTIPFEAMFDLAGFLVCPEHHERRYGWRSPRLKHGHPDYGESQLEQDQAVVRELFGE